LAREGLLLEVECGVFLEIVKQVLLEHFGVKFLFRSLLSMLREDYVEIVVFIMEGLLFHELADKGIVLCC